MNAYILPILLFLCLANYVAGAERFPVPEFDHEGTAAWYVVSLPPGYDATRAWPLVLDFHGAATPGSEGANLTRINLWSHFVQQAPYIVVGINGRTRAWNMVRGPKDDTAYALHVLNDVQKRFAIDPERIYLSGFSAGANFVCEAGLQLKAAFAGSLAVCPGPSDNRAAALRAVGSHPFYFVAGEEDYVGKSGPWQAFRALDSIGAPVMYREVSRTGHAYPAIAEYAAFFAAFHRMMQPAAETDIAELITTATARDDFLLLTTYLLRLDHPNAAELLERFKQTGERMAADAAAINSAREPGRAYEAWWKIHAQFYRFPALAQQARQGMDAIAASMSPHELYQARNLWFEQRRVAEGGVPGVAFNRRVDSLIEKLKTKGDREAARDEILAMGKATTPAMLARMKDPDFTVRWEMVNIQGYMRDEKAMDALVERILNDNDPHVRWRAMWAVNQYSEISRAQELLREASQSTDDQQRWNAIVGMSMFKMPECLPALHNGVKHSDDWRRWEAINALGRINDESTLAVLEPVIASRNPRERHEAVVSIGKIAGEKAFTVLCRLLEHHDPGIRFRACLSLKRRGDVRAIALIEKRKGKETDPQVLKEIDAALAALSKQ